MATTPPQSPQATGEGDKRAVRAALRQVGLPRAAAREKRAIHFGSGRRANAANAGSVRLDALGLAAGRGG